MDWYLAVLKKYAQFSGRARRKEYWMFTLFNIIIAMGLSIVDRVVGLADATTGLGPLYGLYMLAVLVPALAVSIRRLHDTDRSGWMLLLVFIPILGAFVVLYFMVQEGQAGQNQYGPNPKMAAGPAM
jgi:uncharacterized membrane protein YhaH (DUF805 family)